MDHFKILPTCSISYFVTLIMVIELSGVQFGLKTHAQSQNQTNAEHKFDLRSQVQ